MKARGWYYSGDTGRNPVAVDIEKSLPVTRVTGMLEKMQTSQPDDLEIQP